MADPGLARYAGRFVWLELDFDGPRNRSFLERHAVPGTPTFFVLDPAEEKVVATQVGAMSAPEVVEFLERGAREIAAKTLTPLDSAMARGDARLAAGSPADAARAYREALRLAPPTGSRRALAVASLVRALQASRCVAGVRRDRRHLRKIREAIEETRKGSG